MIWVDKAKRFLIAICAKDLDIMSDLFADDIHFRSWACNVKGKDAAILANKNHLDLVYETKIQIHNTAYKDKYIVIECELTHSYIYNVADVFDSVTRGEGTVTTTNLVYIIEFNDSGKIKALRSYKLK